MYIVLNCVLIFKKSVDVFISIQALFPRVLLGCLISVILDEESGISSKTLAGPTFILAQGSFAVSLIKNKN